MASVYDFEANQIDSKPVKLSAFKGKVLLIVNTASAVTNAKTSNAVGVAVLKKAMDTQATAAATLLQALPSPQPALASSGTLGTQVNAFA